MRRSALALLTTLALVLMVPVIRVVGIGLTQIQLNCDDGNSFTAVVDTDTLTALTDSVNAMTNYPAGLNCLLLQTPLTKGPGGIVALADSPKDFAVAGFQFEMGEACRGNFAFSANLSQSDVPTSAKGSIAETIPSGGGCDPSMTGHFKATVDCFQASGNVAVLTGHVVEADGAFASLLDKEVSVSATDGGSPSAGQDGFDVNTEDAATCVSPGDPVTPPTNGNITIRDN